MEQKIAELTNKEKAWIESQLSGATKLIEIMVPEAAGQRLALKTLDQAFAGWMATDERDADVINAVINQVGIAFGQFLVDEVGLRWVIATDKHGSDLALYGLPGKGDVLIYPANLVAKRWERRETQFLENCFQETATRVKTLSSSGDVPGTAPKGFFKRLFGK